MPAARASILHRHNASAAAPYTPRGSAICNQDAAYPNPELTAAAARNAREEGDVVSRAHSQMGHTHAPPAEEVLAGDDEDRPVDELGAAGALQLLGDVVCKAQIGVGWVHVGVDVDVLHALAGGFVGAVGEGGTMRGVCGWSVRVGGCGRGERAGAVLILQRMALDGGVGFWARSNSVARPLRCISSQ